ncbi:MAG: DNA methylase N-4/N-6 domain protein [Thermotogales bacterium 46_20]|nr:MAG: DNA methylase N-4/N-6 domain protein [Thermotogales bacterium 46_20]
MHGARALAERDRYQFEWWALGKVGARPAQDKKKGADRGIDGYIFFFDDNSGTAKKIAVQVKSGHVTASQIRDLKGVMEREEAAIPAFVTLEDPTKPMKQEAVTAVFYEPYHFPKVPKIQIRTIEELQEGTKKLEYPRLLDTTFKKAQRKKKGKQEEQIGF